jgi:hypothetical protein
VVSAPPGTAVADLRSIGRQYILQVALPARRRKIPVHRSELKFSAGTLDVNPDWIQSLPRTKAPRKMRQEFFGSYAEMHEADNDVWTDAAMKFGTYSFLAFALVVILAECGHMVYHLTTLFW